MADPTESNAICSGSRPSSSSSRPNTTCSSPAGCRSRRGRRAPASRRWSSSTIARYIQNTGDRFRFTTLQSRFAAFIDLWDRGLRAREEGRPGPFAQKRAPTEPEKKGPEDRILHVASFRDPVREMDKLTDLYDSLAEARREVGEDAVPFHKFAELVKNQVKKLRQTGSAGGGVSRGGEGRESELYGAGAEGCEGRRMSGGLRAEGERIGDPRPPALSDAG